MLTLETLNMKCGHCMRVITQAVSAAYPAAKVHVDLATCTGGWWTPPPRATPWVRRTEAGYQSA